MSVEHKADMRAVVAIRGVGTTERWGERGTHRRTELEQMLNPPLAYFGPPHGIVSLRSCRLISLLYVSITSSLYVFKVSFFFLHLSFTCVPVM